MHNIGSLWDKEQILYVDKNTKCKRSLNCGHIILYEQLSSCSQRDFLKLLFMGIFYVRWNKDFYKSNFKICDENNVLCQVHKCVVDKT